MCSRGFAGVSTAAPRYSDEMQARWSGGNPSWILVGPEAFNCCAGTGTIEHSIVSSSLDEERVVVVVVGGASIVHGPRDRRYLRCKMGSAM